MALEKADYEGNRRRTFKYVEDSLRSPTPYKDIYYARRLGATGFDGDREARIAC